MKRISDESDLTIGRAIDIFESALSLLGITDALELARWAVVAVDDDAARRDETMPEAEFVRRVADRLAEDRGLAFDDIVDTLPAKYVPEDAALDDLLDGLDELDIPEPDPIEVPRDPEPTPDEFGPYWGVDRGTDVYFGDKPDTTRSDDSPLTGGGRFTQSA
jgi:hypothetical protein